MCFLFCQYQPNRSISTSGSRLPHIVSGKKRWFICGLCCRKGIGAKCINWVHCPRTRSGVSGRIYLLLKEILFLEIFCRSHTGTVQVFFLNLSFVFICIGTAWLKYSFLLFGYTQLFVQSLFFCGIYSDSIIFNKSVIWKDCFISVSR